jgi:hypothetical protein
MYCICDLDEVGKISKVWDFRPEPDLQLCKDSMFLCSCVKHFAQTFSGKCQLLLENKLVQWLRE